MKKMISTLLLLAVAVFAQTPAENFGNAYWMSVSPEVRALKVMEPFSAARLEKAVQLAASGNVIDHQIQALGSNPWETMMLRKAYGYTWVPSLLQDPIIIAPGLTIPGVPSYNPNKPPAGSVKVSVDLADYPAFDKPVEAPSVEIPAKPWFEVAQGPGRYSIRPGDASPAGALYKGAEGTFVKVKIASPFGFWSYWEVVK